MPPGSPRGGGPRRLLWFVALYGGSLAAFTAITWLLRKILVPGA